MSRSYRYAIAQLQANEMRGERLNLALVVFGADDLRVHVARNLEKVRAISAALSRAAIEQALFNLREIDSDIVSGGNAQIEDRIEALSQLSPMGFTDCGQFFASNASAYDEAVERLLRQLVEPEPPLRTTKPAKKTRLLTSIKSALRAEKILAKRGEGIDSHRIVADEVLADGLSADLLLKNGSMHVVQTVDASHIERAKKAIQEIGVSALVFEQARIKFGDHQTSPRLVYSASSQLENSISPALYAAEHQGAELINWESQDQRTRFVVDMSSLAEPTTGQKSADFGRINASTRDVKRLN